LSPKLQKLRAKHLSVRRESHQKLELSKTALERRSSSSDQTVDTVCSDRSSGSAKSVRVRKLPQHEQMHVTEEANDSKETEPISSSSSEAPVERKPQQDSELETLRKPHEGKTEAIVVEASLEDNRPARLENTTSKHQSPEATGEQFEEPPDLVRNLSELSDERAALSQRLEKLQNRYLSRKTKASLKASHEDIPPITSKDLSAEVSEEKSEEPADLIQNLSEQGGERAVLSQRLEMLEGMWEKYQSRKSIAIVEVSHEDISPRLETITSNDQSTEVSEEQSVEPPDLVHDLSEQGDERFALSQRLEDLAHNLSEQDDERADLSQRLEELREKHRSLRRESIQKLEVSKNKLDQSSRQYDDEHDEGQKRSEVGNHQSESAARGAEIDNEPQEIMSTKLSMLEKQVEKLQNEKAALLATIQDYEQREKVLEQNPLSDDSSEQNEKDAPETEQVLQTYNLAREYFALNNREKQQQEKKESLQGLEEPMRRMRSSSIQEEEEAPSNRTQAQLLARHVIAKNDTRRIPLIFVDEAKVKEAQQLRQEALETRLKRFVGILW